MIKIEKVDITTLDVDCIVNAANTGMRGGGGVDGAIHRAAGPKLLEECIQVGPCKTGQVKLTKGYNLKARYIIHAVGPVWYGGDRNERELLRSCYTEAMKLAKEKNFTSIAFPAISCGIYGFPIEDASYIAVKAVDYSIQKLKMKIDVIFSCFSDDIEMHMKQAYEMIWE